MQNWVTTLPGTQLLWQRVIAPCIVTYLLYTQIPSSSKNES